MSRKNETKAAIVQSALYLFHIKGFHATSIRDISSRAGVNSATISYYFKNKNGLLEYCLTSYLEEYLLLMERHFDTLYIHGPLGCLERLVRDIFDFQRANHLAARFVYGEISLDSSLNREILSTYWTKEKYYLTAMLEAGIEEGIFRSLPSPLFILQLKGLLTAPLLHAQYAMEVLYQFPNEEYFTRKYREEIHHYIHMYLLDRTEAPMAMAGV
ncbi:forespore capture DNA-binding protein RefZ [Peribacillus sp. SCS-37]|uniref:forespore capture DNA-binding protein RefZ n=1 Tax=Paraperibacillus esterisolvens TaxID=3115296 RepID=UPI0039057687